MVYRIQNKDNIYKQYSTKVAIKAGDIIEVRLENQEGSTDTIIKKLIAVIDVPDREENFENIVVPKGGFELPIVTPNYYTTAVRLNSMQVVNGRAAYLEYSINPCVIRLLDATGEEVQSVVDVTWQGYSKELL